MDGQTLDIANTSPATIPFVRPEAKRCDLDVGVIFTGETDLLPRLLTTLAASAAGLRVRLILVENTLGHDLSRWTGLFDATTLVRNDRRLGYAENLNRVLEQASSPYVLLLNTDMRFDPEAQCLARMVRFMEQHPDCGVSGCRLYHADGTYAHPARRFQTVKTLLARRFKLASWLPGELERYLYADHDHHSAFGCDWLSGCFLMVRRAAIEQVGKLDARFPKYFEDVDLCLRMALGGWRVMFNGDTYGYHLEQRASAKWLSRDAWLHFVSYVRWLHKWGFLPDQRIAGALTDSEPACLPASVSTPFSSIPGEPAEPRRTRAA